LEGAGGGIGLADDERARLSGASLEGRGGWASGVVDGFSLPLDNSRKVDKASGPTNATLADSMGQPGRVLLVMGNQDATKKSLGPASPSVS